LELLINQLSNDKFEVIIYGDQQTKHLVSISDGLYFSLTSKKISKKELLKYSFQFLLERELNTTILSSFELTEISKYFPEYLKKVKDYCKI
jgi:hypothetical protein